MHKKVSLVTKSQTRNMKKGKQEKKPNQKWKILFNIFYAIIGILAVSFVYYHTEYKPNKMREFCVQRTFGQYLILTSSENIKFDSDKDVWVEYREFTENNESKIFERELTHKEGNIYSAQLNQFLWSCLESKGSHERPFVYPEYVN